MSWRFSTKKRFSKTIILYMPLKTNMDTPKWWAERKMYLLLGYGPIFGIIKFLESRWPWRLWVQWIVLPTGFEYPPTLLHSMEWKSLNGNSWYKWQGPATKVGSYWVKSGRVWATVSGNWKACQSTPIHNLHVRKPKVLGTLKLRHPHILISMFM